MLRCFRTSYDVRITAHCRTSLCWLSLNADFGNTRFKARTPQAGERSPIRFKDFVKNISISGSVGRSTAEGLMAKSTTPDYSGDLQRAVNAVRLACLLCEVESFTSVHIMAGIVKQG